MQVQRRRQDVAVCVQELDDPQDVVVDVPEVHLGLGIHEEHAVGAQPLHHVAQGRRPPAKIHQVPLQTEQALYR